MTTFIVDGRVQDMARALLPENVRLQVVDIVGDPLQTVFSSDQPVLAGISLSGHAPAFRSALSVGPFADLDVVELDPKRPADAQSIIALLLGEVQTSTRQAGEARLTAARLRAENMAMESRLRDIENLLYGLGNPQFSNDLSWQPTGRMLTLAAGQSVTQTLPLNAVSLSAVDLWFPGVVMPVIAQLSVTIEDTAGQVHPLQPAGPEMGIETGWMRFALAAPIAGTGRDCRLCIRWSGAGQIALGLGLAVPDPQFRAQISEGAAPDETLALRVWKSLGGVRLPSCAPAISSGQAVHIRDAGFVPAAALPRPDLFALPMLAADHVSTAFWEKEDAILVHPSRSGPACAIVRDVDLAGLTHVSGLVTVGHVRAPSLNFAIGVAPHGAVDEDGFWQRRIGPWVTGLPARGWAQAHCIPVEPITGRADLLLAVSLAADVPNDLSWGLFRGFRFSRGDLAVAS